MEQPRPENLLPHLPPAGHPLLVVPADTSAESAALWRVGGQTWLAPVLDCGLVAWSKSCPMTPAIARREAVRLAVPGLLDRARGEEPHRPHLLPERGQPVVVNFDHGVAYWLQHGRLMHGPWFDDGLIGWGPVGPVDRPDADPAERAAIDEAVRTLRAAAPGGPHSKLDRPERDGQPRDVVVANRWISTSPRAAEPKDSLLTLRTKDGYRLHVGDAVVLDRRMVLDLAAEVAAYPGTADDESDEPPVLVVRHPEPDHDDGIVTTWHVDDGLAVLHDLRHAPLTVWLRAQEDHPLTEDRAVRLASALSAAAARLDRVYQLAVTAVRRDHDRHIGVRAEADFAAALRGAKGGVA